MPHIRKDRSVSDAIAAQTVRYEASRLVFQLCLLKTSSDAVMLL